MMSSHDHPPLTKRDAAPDGNWVRSSVATKDAATAPARHHISPHLLDLKTASLTPNNDRGAFAGAGAQGRKIAAKFGSGTDLQDVRQLTIAPRARGWKDFPPPEATSVGHAVWLTVRNFFSQHPLADLTILTVVHLLAVLSWKTVTLPWKLTVRLLTPRPAQREPRTQALLPFMPLAAVQTRTLPPQNLRLSLRRESDWTRRLVGFASVCLLLILPFGVWGAYAQLRETKQLAVADGLKAVSLLKGAGQAATNRRFGEAATAFAEAERSFASAKEKTGTLGNLVMSAAAVVPARSRLSAAAPLLNAGKELAAGGAALAAAFAAFDTQKEPTAKIAELRGRLGEAPGRGKIAHQDLAREPASGVCRPARRSSGAASQTQLPPDQSRTGGRTAA